MISRTYWDKYVIEVDLSLKNSAPTPNTSSRKDNEKLALSVQSAIINSYEVACSLKTTRRSDESIAEFRVHKNSKRS